MSAEFLDNRLVIAIVSLVAGTGLAHVVERLRKKRGVLSYFVRHSQVGTSVVDPALGSVQITWNGNPVVDLYSSTMEIRNESVNDYDDVCIHVFTSDTVLLTERAELVGTLQRLNWTREFVSQLAPVGQGLSETQHQLLAAQREYHVPILNRGEVVRLTFLNAPRTDKPPTVWLDVVHKGLKVRFRVPQAQILGVSRSTAGWVGAVMGVVVLVIMISLSKSVFVVGVLCMLYGLVAQLPAALVIRLFRRLRRLLSD